MANSPDQNTPQSFVKSIHCGQIKMKASPMPNPGVKRHLKILGGVFHQCQRFRIRDTAENNHPSFLTANA
jgi:hypothetical protein